jgi:hypothetical protein
MQQDFNEPIGLPLLLNQEGDGMNQQGSGTINFPAPMEVFSNIAKQKAFETVGRKVGLPALGQVLGMNSLYANPFGMALLGPVGAGISSLFGGIKQKFENYKNQKNIARESNKDLQDRIDKGQFGSVTPTPQDFQKTNQYTAPDGQGDGGGGFTSQDAGREGYGAGGQYR